MRIADSYFVKLENGTTAWLAVGKGVPDGATIIEVRPMIVPDFGMVLKHKETGEESTGHWLRGEQPAEEWEEVEAHIQSRTAEINELGLAIDERVD